ESPNSVVLVPSLYEKALKFSPDIQTKLENLQSKDSEILLKAAHQFSPKDIMALRVAPEDSVNYLAQLIKQNGPLRADLIRLLRKVIVFEDPVRPHFYNY